MLKKRTAWNKNKKLSEEHKRKLSISHKGKTPWNKSEIYAMCQICAGKYKIIPSRVGKSRFCSQKCFGLSQRGKKSWNKGRKTGIIPRTVFKKGMMLGENHPNWKGGLPNCVDCGKKLSTRYSKTKRCRKCVSPYVDRTNIVYPTGENHWNWKGGNYKRKDERNDSLYQNWVLQVKKRDNWKCRINNKDCSGHCIVHHILPWRDFPELRYNIENGITLCQAHHPRKRAEEKRLIPFFTGLVSVSSRIL